MNKGKTFPDEKDEKEVYDLTLNVLREIDEDLSGEPFNYYEFMQTIEEKITMADYRALTNALDKLIEEKKVTKQWDGVNLTSIYNVTDLGRRA